MITLYGIKNCDTVKKARRWLDDHGVEHRFHDFRVDGLAAEQVRGWLAEVGDATLINRRGPSWRKIPESEREDAGSEQLVALMVAHPTIIKRPVLDLGDRRVVGYSDAGYKELFS